MVYIDRNGRVLEKRPWNMERIIEMFTGLWFVVVQFFKTLFAPLTQDNRSGGSNNRRGGGSWGSGGGYGGGGGGGGGGSSRGSGSGGGSGSGDGLRPNRRIGRVTNSMDCNVPGGG